MMCARLVALLLAMASPVVRAQPVQIEYWEKWTGEEGRAMLAIVEEFNASQDRVHVNLTTVSQIDQKLLLSVLAKSPPDVAGLWAPFVASYAERGLISPLDGLIDQHAYPVYQLMPSMLDLCRHQGVTWALPSSSMCLMLYVNEQALIDSGFPAGHRPRDLEELMAMSRRMTRVRVVRTGLPRVVAFDDLTEAELAARSYEIVRLGFDPTVAQPWLPYLSGWFGGRVVASDGSIDYSDAGLQAAIGWYAEFFETFGLEHVRRFGSAYGGAGSAGNPFFSGRVAMVINGPWLPRFIAEFAPELPYAIAPLPVTSATPPGASPTLLDSDILVIPRGAAHPEAAFAFVSYVTRPDVLERLNLAQSKIAPVAAPTSDFFEQHPNPEISAFFEAATGPGAFPPHQSVVFSRLVSDLFTAFDLASVNADRAADFLNRASKAINRKVGYAQAKWRERGERLKAMGNLR